MDFKKFQQKINLPRNGKTCQNCQCWHVFVIVWYLTGPLVAEFLHSLVEEFLSFDLSDVKLELVKNLLQKLGQCEAALNFYMIMINSTKSLKIIHFEV